MRLASYRDYAAFGEKYLSSKGIDQARISSERLLEKVLGQSRMALFLKRDLEVTHTQKARFFDLLRKRSQFYPLQYLIGETAFRELVLETGEGALIPRPETELLVETLHEHFSPEDPFLLLDIGTGTGNIALTAADEFSRAEIWAVDISDTALEIAARNARKNGLKDRVTFLKSDLTHGLSEMTFDVIVSNPPYIPEGEKETLQKEVGFEPVEALFGGKTGLEVIERIFDCVHRSLKPNGLLILEIGAGQLQAVTGKGSQNGFELAAVRNDYNGIERILTFQLSR